MRTLFLLITFFYFSNLFGQERVFNPNKSFSFIPMENWENHSKENTLTFAQPLKNKLDNYQENIQISEYPANGMSIEELWKAFVLRDFPKSFENYKFIQSWDSNINDKKAKWIEFTNTANNVKFKNLVYMLVENDKMYYLICMATETEYPQSEKEFRQMINTLQIK
jgi:hypothetical protein